MKYALLISLLIPMMMIAADHDMDGVSDDRDQCQDTPFWVVVNSRGCPIKRIQPRRR